MPHYTDEPLAYVRMAVAQADADIGKLAPGQVVALPESKAARWLRAGVALPATQADYEAYRSAPEPEAEAGDEPGPISAESGLRSVFAHLNASAVQADRPDDEPAKPAAKRRK